MPYRLWIIVGISGFAWCHPVAGGEQPLQATSAIVQREPAMVRSGPGSEFYPTQSLSVGDEVEVYRYDGDWAAIRPPTGSFSWLSAEHVAPTDRYDVAQVQDGPVKTRVGSLLTQERYVAYVTLQSGDRVKLLAPDAAADSAAADEEWLRIAPPAGEFRWIHRRDLDDGPASTHAPDESAVVSGAGSRHPHDAADPAETTPNPSLQTSLHNLRQAIHAILPDDASPDSGSTDRGPWDELPPGEIRLASAESPGPLEDEPADRRPPVSPDWSGNLAGQDPPGSPAPASFSLASELTRVAADLSQSVSQRPETWQLGPLQRRTQSIIDASDSPEVRDQGLQLLARIAQFEDLQRRHRQLARQSSASRWSDSTAQRSPAPRARPGSLPAIDVKHYDGFGWLMPVASQNQRAPRYVLTDENGNILQFVTPSPGMNLRRYERKQVGVYGQRGFLPSLQQPHLVAERIVTIDALR